MEETDSASFTILVVSSGWVQQKQGDKLLRCFMKTFTRSTVLMDDAVNFPIIYLVNDSSYFILPYQNEFS